jgi:tRNA(Arg) A34 adenosine deaminase TadA
MRWRPTTFFLLVWIAAYSACTADAGRPEESAAAETQTSAVEDAMHEDLIKQCYALAQSAVKKGNHPFGALLFKDGEVILTAENTIVTEKDVTGHAELNLIRMAGKQFDGETLSRATLYTSTEPCIMCQGSIYWAGVPKVVYGVTGSSLAEMGGAGWYIPSREIYDRMRPKIEVIGPVLEEEGMEIHKAFWK